MSETVHTVTDLPTPAISFLKKAAKRTLVATAILGVAAVAYVKLTGNGEEIVNGVDLTN